MSTPVEVGEIVQGPYRPHICVILAMSADGKISDTRRTAARFPSQHDQAHLETQLAQADAALFGAGTLRAYGTTLSIQSPELKQQRQLRRQPEQPLQIVCSASGDLVPDWRFFAQPVPRWLLTTAAGAQRWQGQPEFERLLVVPGFDWPSIMIEFARLGIHRLLVMGGGTLVASLVTADLVDELWLTLCPLLIGGSTAPTPVDGIGGSIQRAPRLRLLSVKTLGDEVFLHYQRQRAGPESPGTESKVTLP